VDAGARAGLGGRGRQAARLAVRAPALAALAQDESGGQPGAGGRRLHRPDGDDLVFAGKIGTGFDTRLLLDLRALLDALEIPASPFTRAVGLPRLRAHWVRPEIVVQVAFIEWTVHGKLRHPRLLGVRLDKDARQVVREQP
jgi:ATP-dependent DNA ligase